MTLSQAIDWLTAQLPDPEAKTEARWILQHTLGVNRAYLMTHDTQLLRADQQKTLENMITRRQSGEPLAYILGYTEFYGYKLQVSPAVLIPRADTELLVDLALELMPQKSHTQVLDLGTGSGAIAIAIAAELPHTQVTAIDASREALSIAQDNACYHKLNIRFQQSNWFTQLPNQSFDLIVSNPPYIVDNDPHLQQTGLPFEPINALTSGTDGLNDIRIIIDQAPMWLHNTGWLLIEHGYHQGESVRNLFAQAGFSAIHTHQDLGQQDRVTLGQWIHAK